MRSIRIFNLQTTRMLEKVNIEALVRGRWGTPETAAELAWLGAALVAWWSSERGDSCRFVVLFPGAGRDFS